MLAARTEGGHQTGVHRFAVEPDRAGATIAGVAALLDPERALIAKEGAQALARRWRRRDPASVDDISVRSLTVVQALTPSTKFGADLLGEVTGDMLFVRRR